MPLKSSSMEGILFFGRGGGGGGGGGGHACQFVDIMLITNPCTFTLIWIKLCEIFWIVMLSEF